MPIWGNGDSGPTMHRQEHLSFIYLNGIAFFLRFRHIQEQQSGFR